MNIQEDIRKIMIKHDCCSRMAHDKAAEEIFNKYFAQQVGNVSPTEGTARSAQPQLSDVRELVEMVEAIPCICEECYTSRKLTQPDCPKCNYISVDVINKVKAHF